MRRVIVLAGVLLGASVVAVPAQQPAAGVFGSPTHFTETGGAAIYHSICAGCHMANGNGAVGAGAYPALAHDANLAAAGYPIGIVLHGQRAMPPFARLLSDRQIADVVAYIRQSFGNSFADPVTSDDVKALRAQP
jgi:mono/diheme cytochrome c family protein